MTDSVFDPLMAEIQAEDQQKLCPQCGCCMMVKRECRACEGEGFAVVRNIQGRMVHQLGTPCVSCNGTGYQPCEWCPGTGTITSTSFFDLGGGNYQKMSIEMECTHCKGEKLQRVCAGGCTTDGRHSEGGHYGNTEYQVGQGKG